MNAFILDEVTTAMRVWAADAFPHDEEYITDEATYQELKACVIKHYDGGLSQFLQDAGY